MWLICKVVESDVGTQVITDKFQECEDSLTFGGLYQLLNLDTAFEVKSVSLSASGKSGDNWTSAELTHPVSIAAQFNKSYVKFLVKKEITVSCCSSLNAFDMLMAGSRRLHSQEKHHNTPQLPNCKDESGPRFTQKDAMFNHIVGILENSGLMFENKNVADGEGALLVRVLTDVLWTIDEHHEKINHRATFSSEISSIPVRFSGCRGFNDARKKKISTRLDRKTLVNVSTNLFQALSLPVYTTEGWKLFQRDIEKLALCLMFYTDNMEKETQNQQLRQSSLCVIARPFDVLDVEPIYVISPLYKDLDLAISCTSEYEVIQTDLYAPVEKSKRYLFFKNLRLSTPVQVYRYHQSGSLGTLNFIWPVHKEPKHRSTTRMVETIEKVKSTIPTYHTRALRREFSERFRNVSKLPPVVLAEIYRTLTSDATANDAVRRRLVLFLDADYDYLCDESIVVDLRHLYEGKSSIFEPFWLYLEKVLQDYCEAADDRRHGVAHLPLAVSIPDLKKTVVEKIPAEYRITTAIPSDECVRLQFLPMNEHAHSSVKFTKRFNIRYKVQRRALRTVHQDNHYTASLFKYIKSFCVRYRMHAMLLSCDDKHSIQVGEPQHPVAALDRGRHVIGRGGIPIVSLDHDVTKAKITPSVTLVAEIPTSVSEGFYRGKVYVHVKDSIFSPSSPLVHCCELEDILSASSPGGNIPPILALYTDGGPDHRTTYGSVQVALIGVFKRYDLDLLVACRTTPGQSFINPVERIMSLLNLGLHGVALERSEMSVENEALLKSCHSMADIREEASKNPQLQAAYGDSIQSTIDLVVSRFNLLSLKDETVCAMSSSTDEDELERLFSFSKLIDNELVREKATKKDLALRKKYQNL